jgi:hypothetical protein
MLLFADVAGKKISIDGAPAVRALIIVSGARRINVREILFHIFLSRGRNDDHSRCLLFDTPLDLIGRHIKQTVFRTTFHIGTR